MELEMYLIKKEKRYNKQNILTKEQTIVHIARTRNPSRILLQIVHHYKTRLFLGERVARPMRDDLAAPSYWKMNGSSNALTADRLETRIRCFINAVSSSSSYFSTVYIHPRIETNRGSRTIEPFHRTYIYVGTSENEGGWNNFGVKVSPRRESRAGPISLAVKKSVFSRWTGDKSVRRGARLAGDEKRSTRRDIMRTCARWTARLARCEA